MSCGVGCRRGLDPTLMWLWCSPAAMAPIRPLVWEPPYAMGVAQEMAKRQKKKKKITKQSRQLRKVEEKWYCLKSWEGKGMKEVCRLTVCWVSIWDLWVQCFWGVFCHTFSKWKSLVQGLNPSCCHMATPRLQHQVINSLHFAGDRTHTSAAIRAAAVRFLTHLLSGNSYGYNFKGRKHSCLIFSNNAQLLHQV